MSELLAKLEAGHVVAIVAIIGGLLTVCITAVCVVWQGVRRHEADTALKQDMLNRGIPADEMQKILEASSAKSPATGMGVVGGMVMSAEAITAHIGKTLIARGVTGDGLALVMPGVQAASLETKEAIANALDELDGEDAGEEQVLSLVRSLCRLSQPQPAVTG